MTLLRGGSPADGIETVRNVSSRVPPLFGKADDCSEILGIEVRGMEIVALSRTLQLLVCPSGQESYRLDDCGTSVECISSTVCQ